MTYQAKAERYQGMRYRRAGKSGIRLPMLSLGLWQNFGDLDTEERMREMVWGL